MALIGRLMVEISGDSRKLGKAAKEAKGHLGTVEKASKSLNLSLGKLAGFFSAGLLIRAGKQWIDAADQVGKFSERVGLSVQFLTRMQYAAEQSGVSLQTFQMAMQRGQRRLAEFRATGKGEAVPALDLLGEGFKEAVKAGAGMEQLLPKIADRLLEVNDKALRTVIAMKLFDSEGVGLLQMFDRGSAGLRQYTREADELGITLRENTTRAAAEFNRALSRLRNELQGPGIALLNQLTPLLTATIEQFTETTQAVETGWRNIGEQIGLAAGGIELFFKTWARELEAIRSKERRRREQGAADERATKPWEFSQGGPESRRQPRWGQPSPAEWLRQIQAPPTPGGAPGFTGPIDPLFFQSLADVTIPKVREGLAGILDGLGTTAAAITEQIGGSFGALEAGIRSTAEQSQTVLADLSTFGKQVFVGFAGGIGGAFAAALVYAEDFKQGVVGVLKSLLVTSVATFTQMLAQWIIAKFAENKVAAASHTAKIGMLTAQAAAAAFAAYIGIPGFGPGLAASAAASAIKGTIGAAAAGHVAGTAAGAAMGASSVAAGAVGLDTGASILADGLVYAHRGERMLNESEVRRTTPLTEIGGGVGGFTQRIEFRIGDETLAQLVTRALHRELVLQGVTA